MGIHAWWNPFNLLTCFYSFEIILSFCWQYYLILNQSLLWYLFIQIHHKSFLWTIFGHELNTKFPAFATLVFLFFCKVKFILLPIWSLRSLCRIQYFALALKCTSIKLYKAVKKWKLLHHHLWRALTQSPSPFSLKASLVVRLLVLQVTELFPQAVQMKDGKMAFLPHHFFFYLHLDVQGLALFWQSLACVQCSWIIKCLKRSYWFDLT